MSLLFCDSYDHYTTLATKWSSVGGPSTGGSIDNTGTLSRTGPGALIIPAAFGPRFNFTGRTQLVMGSAFFIVTLSNNQDALWLRDSVHDATQVAIKYNANGSLSVWNGNSTGNRTLLGTSAAGVVSAGVYNYIEAKCVIAAAGSGRVTVRVNGAQVMDLMGVETQQPGTSAFVDTFQPMGAGGAAGDRHDDSYLLDALVSPNNDFLGPIKIFALLPTADSSPLQWTPNSGVNHFSRVNENPPDDDTSFVSDNNPGDKDQYVYTPGLSNVTIFGAQHVLDARLDTGSRSIGSCVNGSVAGNLVLTTSYVMLKVPYDTNPATGFQFKLADFPSTVFGPAVTS